MTASSNARRQAGVPRVLYLCVGGTLPAALGAVQGQRRGAFPHDGTTGAPARVTFRLEV